MTGSFGGFLEKKLGTIFLLMVSPGWSQKTFNWTPQPYEVQNRDVTPKIEKNISLI